MINGTVLSRLGAVTCFLSVSILSSVACSNAHESTEADEVRIVDAMKISYQLTQFLIAEHKLPSKLQEMDGLDGWKTPLDPVSKRPYEYRLVSNDRYELCVSFDGAIEPRRGERVGIRYGDPLTHGYGYWVHGAGRQCVQRTLP